MANVKPLTLVNGVPTGLQPTDKIIATDIQETPEKQFVTATEKELIGTGGGGGITAATATSIAAAMAIALG